MRKLLLLIVVFCTFTLTGCAQLIDLTDEESDVLAEYMAGTVLKYDRNYTDALIEPKKQADTTKTAEMADTVDETVIDSVEETVVLNNSVKKESIQQVSEGTTSNSLETTSSKEDNKDNETVSKLRYTNKFKNGNFSITYNDYKIYDSYPSSNDYFSLETNPDRQIFVVTFQIKNLSDKTEKIDLINSGFNYELQVNSGTTYKPKLTLLNNDIQYINMDIAAGKSQEALVVFDVLRDVDMSKINLIISNQDKTAAVQIK